MLFNPDDSIQAQEIGFSRKKNPSNHYDIDMLLIRKNTQKHLELYLDTKLNFFEHINEKKSRQRY